MFERVIPILEACHRNEPWAMGLTSLALSRGLREPEPRVTAELAPALESGRLMYASGYYALPWHEPHLSTAQRAFFEDRMPIDPAAPFAPVSFAAIVADARRARIVGLSRAFDTLLARGEVVHVGEGLYRAAQLAAAQELLLTHLRAHRELTPAQFRDLLGTSRRYAIPLLEWFDARGVTRREGDVRIPSGEPNLNRR